MSRNPAVRFWHMLRPLFQNRHPQVTLIGNPFEAIGRSEHLRATWRSLALASVQADIYDVYGIAPEPSVLAEMGHCQVKTIKPGIRVFHLNGNEIASALGGIEARQPAFFQHGYNIVAPVWELPRYPATWARELDRFDEIWVPTAFVEASIRPAVMAPVFRLSDACQPHVEKILEKTHFGIPADSFAILTLFDVRSHVARKNPFAAIEAFRMLIEARPDSPSRLVIKLNYGERAPRVVSEIRDRVASIAHRVTIINATLTNNEIKNLIRCCDCLLSLHRSEGFGRAPAEAMFFGRPVVATGWSGNTDYMNEDVAFPIGFALRNVREGEYPEFEDQVWAEPDSGEAARVLIRIIDQPELARSIGLRARAHMLREYSDAVVGRQYQARLARIAHSASSSTTRLSTINRRDGHPDHGRADGPSSSSTPRPGGKMRIVVIGLGQAGLVTAAGLLQGGHVVVGIDTNAKIRDCVARGLSPFREPGVADLISAGHATGRLVVTANIGDEANADLMFVCVDTKGLEDGALDLSNVTAVARDLGGAVRRRSARLMPVVLAFRSTMLPGSMRDIVVPAIIEAAGEPPGARYEVAYSPVFTREGSGLADYLAPARIVIGERAPGGTGILRDLFAGIEAPVFTTTFEIAELTKFADNSFHALKVAFANEIGRFALRSGISPGEVFDLFLADTKLNLSASYLRPGGAFGGPCLPKDVRALAARMNEMGIASPVLEHVCESNALHTDFLVAEIERRAAPHSRILLVGLSFKTGTDDMRESPFARLAHALLDRGYNLSIYDPDLTDGAAVGAYARLPPRLSAIVLPEVSTATVWDLVVAGKEAPDVLRSAAANFSIFHIDRL